MAESVPVYEHTCQAPMPKPTACPYRVSRRGQGRQAQVRCRLDATVPCLKRAPPKYTVVGYL
jgi:hypothetical protein